MLIIPVLVMYEYIYDKYYLRNCKFLENKVLINKKKNVIVKTWQLILLKYEHLSIQNVYEINV